MAGKSNSTLARELIDHSRYERGYGYDPKAIEHDLIVIRQLMRGKKRITMQLAQEIYYKIKRENIRFQSEKGVEFLDKLSQNMTDAQIQHIDQMIVNRRRRAQGRKRLLRLNKQIAIGMFATALILCVLFLNWNLLLDIRTNYEARRLLKRIVEQERLIEQEQVMSTPEEITDVAINTPAILNKFQMLYDENPDFAGWLTIDGTKIDYPVMCREDDNNYYLNKNFAGQEDKNGLLILDYRCDVTAQMQNIIIYGHNMRTGVMFGTLDRYKDRSFGETHSAFCFDNLYAEDVYELVAVVLSEVAYEDEEVFRYYDAIDISTEESFNAFRENIYKDAIYTIGEELEYGDSCLILSTCDNYTEDGRLVVVARKTQK